MKPTSEHISDFTYFLTDEDLDLARSMSKTRNSTVRASTDYSLGDPVECDVTGAVGEIALGKLLKMDVDIGLKPQGDGGVDFKLFVNHKPVTIDVKTSTYWLGLLVKEKEIRRCADIVVLAYYDKPGRFVTLRGWETRYIVWLMEIIEAKKGTGLMSHNVPADELRHMKELLTKILARRTYEERDLRKNVA